MDDYAAMTGRSAGDILDCSANIHPFGPPSSVEDAIKAALDGVRYYPDPQQRRVKAVLARRFQIEPGNVLCGNGATECLELLVRALRPDRCIVLEPAFGEYEAIAHRYVRPVVRLPLFDGRQFTLPLGSLDEILRPGDMLFLNHPHNPSGASWPLPEWLPRALAWAESGVHVVIDESFVDFLPTEVEQTAVRLAADSANLYVVRSATKVYAIPGLRFGFAVGRSETIAQISQDRDPWSVNHLAQAAASAAYLDVSYSGRTTRWVADAHAWLRESWAVDPRWTLYPTAVNFFLVRFASIPESLFIQQQLRADGIFVRACGNFRELSDAYVRVALRTPEENERVWRRASEASDVYRDSPGIHRQSP